MSEAKRWQDVAGWRPLVATGVLVGTLGDFLVGALFQFVLVIVTRATACGPDSAAMYATWPLYGKFLAYGLAPMSLVVGALAGALIAAVLWASKSSRATTWLLCGLAFSAFRLLWQLPSLGQVLADSYSTINRGIGLVGDVARGAFLAWATEHLYRRWSAR